MKNLPDTMEFDYRELGATLARSRMQKGLRQTDVEELTRGKLHQPAISAAEHGETRLAVDTLVDYCNALGMRTDAVLAPFLTAPPESETSGAIVDAYVIRMAEIMADCPPTVKATLLQMAQLLRDTALKYEDECARLSARCEELEQKHTDDAE